MIIVAEKMEATEVTDSVMKNESDGTQNTCSDSDKDISEMSDNESPLGTMNTSNIKSEIDPDTKVVVLNKDNKFNARRKPDISSLRYDCNLCELAFQYPYQLDRHKRVKHEGKYPYYCKVCNKPFDRNSSLQDHMFVHSEDRPHPCNLCEKSFKMKGNLRKHLREMHIDESEGPKLKFQCEHCFKIFSTKERLTSHFICHKTEKAYSCDVCGKKYKRKNNLQIHAVIHSSDRKYKCPDCYMCFKTKYSLTIHSRNHMAVKPYKCELCPSSFSQLHALKTHFRLHTGEKPFKCTECPQTFRQLATLQVHLKRHSGVKDFSCEVCGRAFVIKRRLTEHMRIHTGEKPFSCKLCPHKTATSSGLRLHNKTHVRQMERSVQKMRSVTEIPSLSADQTYTSLMGTTLDLMKLSGGPEGMSENIVNENEDIGKLLENVSECAIEIVNDVDFDTNGIVIETNTELETCRGLLSNGVEDCTGVLDNVDDCTGVSDNIGAKHSDVRSIASDLNEITDMESTNFVHLKSDRSITDFQFSTREVLYKHLNDLIPTIDADILSSKIDHIVKDLTDVHQINCSKLDRNCAKRRKKQRTIRSLKTSHRNDDLKTPHRNDDLKTPHRNDDLKTPHRNDDLKTLHRNDDLKALHSIADVNTSESNDAVNSPIRDSADSNIGASIRNSLNQPSNTLKPEVQLLDINEVPNIKTEPINEGEVFLSPEPSPSISKIQASHWTLSQCLSSGVSPLHTLSPVQNRPVNIPVVEQSGNTPDHTESTSSIMRKLLTANPLSSMNHSMNSSVTNISSSSHFMNTNSSLMSEINSLSQKKTVSKSTSGKSGVLNEILSKPPQYLIASRNSVATLQYSEQLLVKSKQCKTTERIMSEALNESIDSQFPWISIDKIKLEPLSGDEN